MISGPYSRSVRHVDFPRESEIEARLVKRVAECGAVAEKFTSPNRRNVPDRIIWLGGGEACFVECKAPGRKPTSGQLRDHERRRAAGYRVYVVDSFLGVEQFLADEDMLK